MKDTIDICIVSGVEGQSLVIGNMRVAGPKPWGGGQVVKEWVHVQVTDLVEAICFDGQPRNPTKTEAVVDAMRRALTLDK